MVTKDGSEGEIEATDIELSGKLKTITCAEMDAIGLLKRKGNQTILSFKVSSDDLLAGARPPHLKDQEIVVCEQVDDKFVYHWDKIFLP